MSQHYKRPISSLGCIALLMGGNTEKAKAFIADFYSSKFPEEIKLDLTERLARHLRMLKICELIDEEYNELVRKTTQPAELFEEIQRNKAQRKILRTELERIRQALGLE